MANTDSPHDPVNVLAPKAAGQPAADDHGRMGPPSAEVIARGYEEDTYENGTVLSVPLLVILFFVLAFGTVTVIFRYIAYPPADPRSHPAAADRNKQPLNERLAAIGRTKGGDQPRLEPLKLRSGDARAISRPELPDGNSPEIHPEELRVTKERFPLLYQTGDGRVPLDRTLTLDEKGLAGLFPSKGGPLPPYGSAHQPTWSNSGRGAEAARAVPPPGPKLEVPKAEAKKADDKKPGDKKQPEPPKAPDPKSPETPKKPEEKK